MTRWNQMDPKLGWTQIRSKPFTTLKTTDGKWIAIIDYPRTMIGPYRLKREAVSAARAFLAKGEASRGRVIKAE